MNYVSVPEVLPTFRQENQPESDRVHKRTKREKLGYIGVLLALMTCIGTRSFIENHKASIRAEDARRYEEKVIRDYLSDSHLTYPTNADIDVSGRVILYQGTYVGMHSTAPSGTILHDPLLLDLDSSDASTIYVAQCPGETAFASLSFDEVRSNPEIICFIETHIDDLVYSGLRIERSNLNPMVGYIESPPGS